MLTSTSLCTEIILLLIFLILSCSRPIDQIYMDGQFADWQRLSPVYDDPSGDQLGGNPDLGKLWVTNDADYFYFRVEVGAEINLQNDNELTLFLDTDDNVVSGKLVHGIGADLIYEFGHREGIFFSNSDTIGISHSSIGLVTFPTVTSSQFEIAMSRKSKSDKESVIFSGKSIRLMIMDKIEGGDMLPNKPGGIRYSFRDEVPKPLPPVSIKKDDPNSTRFMTYNTLSDGLFKPGQFAHISKIINAIQPEIMVFQEIYNYDGDEVLQQIESIIPSTNERQWYSVKGGWDNIIVSSFSIDTSTFIDGNGAFLVDLDPRIDSKLLLIGAHLPCCGNNEGRRDEIDALMRFIRESKEGQGGIRLSEDTPIILLGDLNLVGDAQQLNTLLDGSIQDTMRYGSRFAPDWDGSNFADLMPFCTGIPFAFTWYDPNNSFRPGRLDFMIYSDSVVRPVKKFVLFTPAMPPDSLAAYNLAADDTPGASDHLPVVADFILMSD